jgi:hypothetical protein
MLCKNHANTHAWEIIVEILNGYINCCFGIVCADSFKKRGSYKAHDMVLGIVLHNSADDDAQKAVLYDAPHVELDR